MLPFENHCITLFDLSSFVPLFISQVGTNFVEYLDEAKASQPYPYVLLLGNDIQHSSQAFVIVTREALEQKTLLQAVDV